MNRLRIIRISNLCKTLLLFLIISTFLSCSDGKETETNGADEAPCSVTDNEEVTSSDGTSVTVSDGDRTDDTPCSITDNGDGTKTVTCTDGTSVTVSDGNGTDDTSCSVTDNGDGTRTVTCTDGTTIMIFDGDDDTSYIITLTSDKDEDGLTDLYEISHNLDPENSDIDDDGINDGDEVAEGTDPKNPDTISPEITEFTHINTIVTEELSVFFNLEGTDNNEITHWLITTSSLKPSVSYSYWQEVKPTEYLIQLEQGVNSYTLYAWSKDAAGNISGSSLAIEISPFYIRAELCNTSKNMW